MEEASVKPKKAPSGGKITLSKRHVIAVLVIVLVSVFSFVLGVQYERNHRKIQGQIQAMPGLYTNRFDGEFGARAGHPKHRGVFGQVTAVSGSSITIKNTRTNSTATYSISTNTTFSDGGQTSSIAAIKVGDNVLIVPNPSDTKEAESVMRNTNQISPSNQTENSNSTNASPI